MVPGLDDILKIDGVYGALIIRRDCTVVTTAGYLELDTDGISASITLLIAESEIIADRIQNGILSLIFLEFENRLLVIQEIDHDRFMVIITGPGANLGQISYHLKKERQKPVPGA